MVLNQAPPVRYTDRELDTTFNSEEFIGDI